MKVEPLKLPADHDPLMCTECAAAAKDVLRRFARMERTCRCCGTHIVPNEPVFIVGDDNYWRMCGRCWRSGYERGETVDAR